MDSYFAAAADNLDSLLDELEENEDDLDSNAVQSTEAPQKASVSSNMTVQISSPDKPSHPKPSQLEKPTHPTVTSVVIPQIAPLLPSVAKHNGKLPENLEFTSPKFEDSAIQSETLNGIDLPMHSTELSVDKANENENYDPVPQAPSEAIEPEQSEDSECENAVSEDTNNVIKVPLSNSDILMQIFGAEPAPVTEELEAPIPNQILSPLNPFSSNYVDSLPDDDQQVPTPSGIFTLIDQDGENGLMQPQPYISNKSNPFYVVANDTNTLDDVGHEISQPPEPSSAPQHVSSHNSEDRHSPSIEMMSVEGNLSSKTSEAENLQYGTFDHPTEDISVLKKTSKGSDYSEGAFNNVPNETFDAPQPHPESSIDSTMSNNAEEQLASLSENIPTQMDATAVFEEKQEMSSIGFMKDVAVSEEEFERFLAEMEEEEKEARAAVNTESTNSAEYNNPGSNDMNISEPPNESTQNHAQAAATFETEARTETDQTSSGYWANTGPTSGESLERGLAIASAVSQEESASAEIGSSLLGRHDMHPDTVIPPSSEPEPIPVPVSHPTTTATHDGSPTFPLQQASSPVATAPEEIVVTSQPSASEAGNNRLSLNINETRTERSGSESVYPATPPPPYTEEMQANYVRSLSPPPGVERPGQQAVQQSQQEANEIALSQNNQDEDDFSLLPNSVLELIERPGETKPTWVPDQDAPQCSKCANKFTFTRRRHHCRACGRVFCAQCCSEKSQLKYMDYKEARVCLMCSLAIKQADTLAAQLQQRSSQARAPRAPQPSVGPIQAEPAEEAIPIVSEQPSEQEPIPVEEPASMPTEQETVPDVASQQDTEESSSSYPEDMEVEGAMAKASSTKSVRFSDGTRPTHPDEMPSTPPPPSRVNRVRKRQPRDPNGEDVADLPPVIIAHGENGAYAVQENPDPNVILNLLESGDQNPQSFVLNANLIIHVKFVSHENRQCWCYWSEGMDGVGQREVVLLLEREGLGDRQISRDAFTFYTHVFDRARKGKIFNTADFMPRTMLGLEDGENLFGLDRNAGFMFVQATSQALDGLSCLKRKVIQHADGYGNVENNILPVKSMLFAVLVQKNEAPWATLFPMRLMLRLGMEMKQYPCPLFSVRRREPVFHELGHTILAILCDFRNFKYRVVSVPGLRVVITANGSVSVQIPCNRFTDTVRIMNSSNESVLAIGTGTFGPKISPQNHVLSPIDSPCDSHLVCVQDQQNSNYHTEILTMKNTGAMNTGAAFVIFNGSLKSDGSHIAKCAIVEDGIMIQILRDKMEELRASLRSMEDFYVEMAGTTPALTESPEESEGSSVDAPTLEVKWVDDDTAFNIGMFSPIDGTAFEGVIGFNVQGRSEQRGKKHILRWNQVFFLSSTSDPLDMSRLAEQVANGCFLALTPVLQELVKHSQHKVAVRVTIHPENVGYVAGSGLHDLPPACMNALDEHLIQTIHNAASSVAVEQEAVIIELLFSILFLRPAYRMA